jgi:hypothetical protein
MVDPTPLPIACTLTRASLKEREQWLRRLGEAALIDGARVDDRLELHFRPEASNDVRELVRAERECCPFLSFEVELSGEDVRLAVTGPPEAGPVLDALLSHLEHLSVRN